MKYDDPQESVIGVVSLIEQEVNSFLNINSLCAPDSIGCLYFFVAPYCGWPIIPIFSVISYLIPRDENNEIFFEDVLVYVSHENELVPFFFPYTDLVTEVFQEGFSWAYIPASLG